MIIFLTVCIINLSVKDIVKAVLGRYSEQGRGYETKRMVKEITVQIQNSGGRFLKHDQQSNGFIPVDDETAQTKVARALQYQQRKDGPTIMFFPLSPLLALNINKKRDNQGDRNTDELGHKKNKIHMQMRLKKLSATSLNSKDMESDAWNPKASQSLDEVAQSFPLVLNHVNSPDQFSQLQEQLRMAVQLAHKEISTLQQTIRETKFQNELLLKHLEQREQMRKNVLMKDHHHHHEDAAAVVVVVPESHSKDDLPLHNSWQQQQQQEDSYCEFKWPSALSAPVMARAEENYLLPSNIFDDLECIDTTLAEA
jgi:hypothetical protein